MSETSNWNLSVNVVDGPQLSSADSLVSEGYDKLNIVVTTMTSASVTVGPGNWTGVSLLMIQPTPGDPKLTYQSGTVTAALDATHLLVGAGAVSLLGNGPAKLTFNNQSANTVTLNILVGRSAS
jgi:hypothetical protein